MCFSEALLSELAYLAYLAYLFALLWVGGMGRSCLSPLSLPVFIIINRYAREREIGEIWLSLIVKIVHTSFKKRYAGV